MYWNLSYSPETPNLGQIWRFLEPCDLEIWRMTLKNNRSSLLFYFKLCASFRSHWWIQSGVTVRKRPIWVKFDDFQSHLTLKFDGWPWTRQIWWIWKLRPAYSPETPNLGQNRWCFVPCDLEVWWMTLENNRASLLCCFKLCATFPWGESLCYSWLAAISRIAGQACKGHSAPHPVPLLDAPRE